MRCRTSFDRYENMDMTFSGTRESKFLKVHAYFGTFTSIEPSKAIVLCVTGPIRCCGKR